MELNRTKNAIWGTVVGVILQLIQIVFPFVIRTIFIRTIGIQYLGLNSLFVAILQVLNLTELGVSSALIFSMYRPIAEQNHEKICQLMQLYKLYYRIIGIAVLGLGLVLLPFLSYLIHDTIPNDINIYVLFVMHLSATVASYWLFAYRISILQAYQRNDVISLISIIIYLFVYILQIVILINFENYYAYLTVKIIGQIMLNIFTAVVSKRMYPQYEPRGSLSQDEKREINKKVRDLFTSKVGAVINNSADSIVISALLGVELLAVYQNYYYVISSLMAIFRIFFSACTAGIGNSLVVRGERENKKLLYRINHMIFMGLCVCSSCLVCLFQPFMRIWVGEQYMLDFSYVILFTIYLFVEEAPMILVIFKDAGGIWRHDRFRPLTTALVNLSLNLILTPIIGLYGIIISTILAIIFIAFPWVVLNIDKRLFRIEIKKYLIRNALYSTVILTSTLVVYMICKNLYFSNTWLEIFVKLIICVLVSTCFFSSAFWKTEEMIYLVNRIKRAIDSKSL